jgi:hypothetical protein
MGVMSESQQQNADLRYKGQRFFVGEEGKNVLEVLELKFNIVDVKFDKMNKYGPRYNVLINMDDPIPISKQGVIDDGKLIRGLMPEMIVSLPLNGEREETYRLVSRELEIKDYKEDHDPPELMYGPCVLTSDGKRKEIVEWKDKAKAKKLRAANDEGFVYGDEETRGIDTSNAESHEDTTDPFLPDYPDEVTA